jgi:hypothetical protein
MKIAVKIAIASQNRKEITGYAAGAQILNLSNAARDDRQIDNSPAHGDIGGGTHH